MLKWQESGGSQIHYSVRGSFLKSLANSSLRILPEAMRIMAFFSGKRSSFICHR